MKADRPTRATIHLGALRANFAEAARRAGGREPIAVIKADAYGHGAVPVARALAGAGCRRFAVLSTAEAAVLRDAGLDAPLLVLAGAHDDAEAEAQAALGATSVLHHEGQLERLCRAAAGRSRTLPVQVEVDTGMSRMGVAPEDAVALLEAVRDAPGLELEGVFTHFARADEEDLEPSLEQARAFGALLSRAAARGVRWREAHAANSAALLASDALAPALPATQAVRPGLLLYGASPAPHFAAKLEPAMTLRTQVVQVRRIPAGAAVGYAAQYRARRATRIATLAIGYADGVPVAASGRGSVLIRGRRLPIAGRVSMDYLGVVAGDAPVEIGDEAILFGAPELSVEVAAAAARTIAYELLVRVGSRVPREFAE